MVAVGIVVVAPLNAPSTTRVGGSPLLDKPAPPIDLLDLDGQRVQLADYAGRPVIVNFWASWCIPCRDEFPMLIGAYGEHRDRGLEVLGVVHGDTATAARAFAQEQGATWSMVLDTEDVAFRDYIGLGVPQTYFIDADGVVRAFTLGPFSAAGLAAGIATILPAQPTGG